MDKTSRLRFRFRAPSRAKVKRAVGGALDDLMDFQTAPPPLSTEQKLELGALGLGTAAGGTALGLHYFGKKKGKEMDKTSGKKYTKEELEFLKKYQTHGRKQLKYTGLGAGAGLLGGGLLGAALGKKGRAAGALIGAGLSTGPAAITGALLGAKKYPVKAGEPEKVFKIHASKPIEERKKAIKEFGAPPMVYDEDRKNILSMGRSGEIKSMKVAMLDAFSDEMDKIAAKATVYIFKDPMSYAARAKVRGGVRKGMEKVEKTTGLGRKAGVGTGAALGGLGGAAAGYFGGKKRALPAILGGLAGAAAGGLGGYFGGQALGRRQALKKLKEHGVHAVRVKDSPELRQVLRPALQRKGLDVIIQGKTAYKPKDIKAVEEKILSRVGYPDPHVLQSLGLPTLK